MEQLMGDLPSTRTNIPERAFNDIGLDYAGPFYMKDRKGEQKIYICLFICLASKAIHLELSSDMTAAACLAAIKRFVARRGLPRQILSDNGSNFVGVRNELMKNHSRQLPVNWKLIPPASPHFGGIWEAGVKSTKHHLRRIMGTNVLTYEEFNTLLCQIEQVLNSRPLTAVPDNPNDLLVLTPAHLIAGRSLEFFPEAKLRADDIPDTPTGESSHRRWIFIRNLLSTFWKRWSKEYVTTLQQRYKWDREQTNLKIGDVVYISDDNQAPLSWPLGRIIQAYSGHENFVRVAKVKTASGTLIRPITKLRKLPVEA
jgi:hypothetical protein